MGQRYQLQNNKHDYTNDIRHPPINTVSFFDIHYENHPLFWNKY